MKKSSDVSIIILSYNTSGLTLKCFDALTNTQWGEYTNEIICVDNASHDDTISQIRNKYSAIILIQNKENVGFAAGNNIGIQKAKGRYILLLNSDTEVTKTAIPEMLAFMDKQPKAGAASCKLVLSDGTMDPACHRGFPTPWNAFCYYAKLEKVFPKIELFSGYHQGYKNLSEPHEVDAISGAFFLVRKDVIDEVGMFDEEFFMYAEDIDWAYRIKEKGWEIWFNPNASVLHKKKQSGRAHDDKEVKRKMDKYFYETMKLFYKKHYEQVYPRLVTGLVYLALDLRITVLSVLGK